MNTQVKSAKEILSLAIPISLFNLTTVLIAIANGLMLAKLGNTALAAGAIIGAAQISIMMIFSSSLFAISPMVSRMHAEKKYYQIGGLIRQGYLLALIFSIPALLGMILIKPILQFFCQPSDVIELADLYFKSYGWGVPTAMLLTCAQQFMLGLKKTHLVTIIGAVSLIISVCFGYIMAFGKAGFTPQGIKGLGYAQSLRSLIILIVLFILFASAKEFKIFGLYSRRMANKFLELRQIFALGWPISIHAASEYLAIFSLTLIAGGLGQQELIAQQISAQYIQLFSIFILGLSQASNLLVGGSIGRGEFVNMRNYGYVGIILGVCLGLIAILGFSLFPKVLVSPYIDINDTSNLIFLEPFLIITTISILLGAVKSISTGVLRSLYDTKIPMVISVICAWGIAVPLSYISTHTLGLGINGIAMAQVIGFGFCAFFLVDRWRVLNFNITCPPNLKSTIAHNFMKHLIATRLVPRYKTYG